MSAPFAAPRVLVAEVTDAQSRRTHLVTEQAFSAGCRAGRYQAVCRHEVLAARLRYLELLSSVFLVRSIPAWSSGQTHRAVGTPKLAFVDTGIASHLIGQDSGFID